MQADELEDGLALLEVEFEAGQEAIGQLDALLRVLAGAAALAGVVQQKGEEEEIEAVDLRQQLRQALLVLIGGGAQGVHVVDDQEGVLVDGVAVVAIADNESVNAVELGDEHFEHTEGVHGAQGLGRVGPEKNLADGVPEVGSLGDGDGKDGERVGDAVFGGLGKRVAVRGHEREDAENGGGVIELRAGLDVNAALVEEEIGAGDGRAAAAELAVEADRSGQMLHEQGGAAINDAGVAIVGAHPVAGVGGAAGFKADGAGSRFVLRLPVKDIVVAAMAEVEKTSDGGKEIEGGFGVAAGALKDAAALAGPLFGLLEMEKDGEPDGERVVAQTAGAVLDIGLEMEDGVAEFGVAGAGELGEPLGDGGPLAEDETGEGDLMKLLVERELAGEEAAIERGEGELEIVGVEAAGFLDGAGDRAGAKADVPHALDDGAHGFARLLLGLFVGEDEEHVDVGVGEEIFAAVATEGEEGDVLLRKGSEGAAPHFDEDAIDDGRAAANGGRAVAGALAGLADERHLLEILLAKIVDC